MLELLKPRVINHGPFAEHNMPCSVCSIRSAVLNLNEGIFEPCWHCQLHGWQLTRKPKRWWNRG